MADLLAAVYRWVGRGADLLAYYPAIGVIGCIVLAAIVVVLSIFVRLRGSPGSIVIAPILDECTYTEQVTRTVTITHRRK